MEARARQARMRGTEILQTRRERKVELEAREREAEARRVRELIGQKPGDVCKLNIGESLNGHWNWDKRGRDRKRVGGMAC